MCVSVSMCRTVKILAKTKTCWSHGLTDMDALTQSNGRLNAVVGGVTWCSLAYAGVCVVLNLQQTIAWTANFWRSFLVVRFSCCNMVIKLTVNLNSFCLRHFG